MRERLHHLATVENIQSTTSSEFSRWADTRLDRWLVDWCLRYGKERSARMIAKEKGIEVCHSNILNVPRLNFLDTCGHRTVFRHTSHRGRAVAAEVHRSAGMVQREQECFAQSQGQAFVEILTLSIISCVHRAPSNLTLECKNTLNCPEIGRRWMPLHMLRSTSFHGKIHISHKSGNWPLYSHFLLPPLVDHTRSDTTSIISRY